MQYIAIILCLSIPLSQASVPVSGTTQVAGVPRVKMERMNMAMGRVREKVRLGCCIKRIIINSYFRNMTNWPMVLVLMDTCMTLLRDH